MRLVVLSDQLTVKALVSRYLTNKLMVREPLLDEQIAPSLERKGCPLLSPPNFSTPFGMLCSRRGQVAHAFLALPPL